MIKLIELLQHFNLALRQNTETEFPDTDPVLLYNLLRFRLQLPLSAEKRIDTTPLFAYSLSKDSDLYPSSAGTCTLASIKSSSRHLDPKPHTGFST